MAPCTTCWKLLGQERIRSNQRRAREESCREALGAAASGGAGGGDDVGGVV